MRIGANRQISLRLARDVLFRDFLQGWSSPNEVTHDARLYAAILREMKTKGVDARFEKTERGKFSAKAS
jgi:hypothetical protein